MNGRWRLLDPVYAIIRCAAADTAAVNAIDPPCKHTAIGKACMHSCMLSCNQHAVTEVLAHSRLGGNSQTLTQLTAYCELLVGTFLVSSCCCCREGQLPFYLPPEAFIHTHLPFEAYWQLLPNPVSLDQWWQLPEVSLAFCAAGGQLMAEELKSCTVLPAVRWVPISGVQHARSAVRQLTLVSASLIHAWALAQPSGAGSCSKPGPGRQVVTLRGTTSLLDLKEAVTGFDAANQHRAC